ncbi:MAG TPA: dienelactone hydrolase family protein [Polyangiaceae bacterium]|jgi:carboxymethylenebutenolidase|nr:dienelactone hydrolase family protein [Polyangiaceae bacterium]
MNEYQRYFAEEIAEECGHGHISRTEALRRLRVLGVSAAVALSLLAAACGGDDKSPAQSVASNEPTTGMPATESNDSTTPASDGASTGSPAATPSPTPMGSANNEGTPNPMMAAPAAMPGSSTPPAMGMMPPAVENPPATPPADPAAISGVGMGLPTEAITFNGPNGPLQGAFAAAPNPRGAVLVIHENRGLNDHIRTVVGRFAAAGFTAIGLDLLSEEGGTAALGDQANATAALGRVATTRFTADMQACLDELQRRAPNAKIGAVGFCFGGGMMWQLLATKDPRLAAVAPFYGPFPTGNIDFTGSNAAVLAFYGALDARVNGTQAQAEAALTAAGLTHEMVVEPNANHAFFNDTGMSYNAAAAADAWTRVLAWFGEHLS